MLRNIRLSLFILLGIITANNSHAVSVTLKGKIIVTEGALPATVILHSYADESYSASAIVGKDSLFSYQVDLPGEACLYNLRFARSNYDIMLSAKEPICYVEIFLNKDNLRDISIRTPENDAFRALKSTVTLYETKLSKHFTNCKEDGGCDKDLSELLQDYRADLADVQKKNPGTYSANVLCKMKMPPVAKSVKGTTELFRKTYFDGVDFSDSTIFNTNAYREMIATYVDFVFEAKISKEQEFITSITDHIKANPLVLRKSAGLLFDELFNKKREKMLGMFIKWYNNGDNKTTINNPVLDAKVKNISRSMPGQPFIEAVGPDPKGAMRSLKNVVQRSKCTLLLFYSSECSHCREEMPFIKEYYDKYHDKGFDVFAVTLEPDKEKWKAYIAEMDMKWTNIIIGPMSDPNPAREYVTTSTPTLVLIDRNGVILHRFIPKQNLELHIQEALK